MSVSAISHEVQWMVMVACTLCRLNRSIALATFLGLLSIFSLTGIHGYYNRVMGERMQTFLATSSAAAASSLSLIRVVRSHASESHELERYDKELKKTVDVSEAQDCGYGSYR